MNPRRLMVVAAGVSVLAVGAVVLYAAPGDGAERGRVDALFARCDANADGQITPDEFTGPDRVFERMDANGDGVVTREEVEVAQARGRGGAAGAPGRGRMNIDPAERWRQALERFDADGDGQLSAEEFQGPARVFTMLDHDGDGVVTREEGTRLGLGGRGAGAGEGGPAGPGRRGPNFEQMLQRLDQDDDGKISQDEWRGREELFIRLDRDGDGFMTAEEIETVREQQPRPAERPNMLFTLIRIMDENGDGQVSTQEWANFHAAADEDADGLMSQDELARKIRRFLAPKEEPAQVEEN